MAEKPNLTMQFGRLTVRSLVLLYGAGVMIAQVLILRELLALAQGQELKLALGLKPGGQEDHRSMPLPKMSHCSLLFWQFL
jgi:hypothetical protein